MTGRRAVARFLAVLVIAVFFGTGVLRPAPARAVSTAVIVVASIAAYAAAILTVTLLVYRGKRSKGKSFAALETPPTEKSRPSGVRLAPHCRGADGQPALLCW